MLSFRDDFAEEPAEQLLGHLELGVPLDGGVALPDDTVALAIYAYSEERPRIGRLRASIRDGNGDYHDAIFSGLEAGTWTELRTELPAGLTSPLALASLRFMDRRVLVHEDGAIFFDDLTAVRASGAPEVVESFDDQFGWTMYSQSGAAETFGPSDERARSGARSARWTWTREVTDRARACSRRRAPGVPLSAIFSERALAFFGVQPGQRTVGLLGERFAVPLIVRSSAEVFPTLDPARRVRCRGLRAVPGHRGRARLPRPADTDRAVGRFRRGRPARRPAGDRRADPGQHVDAVRRRRAAAALRATRGDRLGPDGAGVGERYPAARVRWCDGRSRARLRGLARDRAPEPHGGTRGTALARRVEPPACSARSSSSGAWCCCSGP